MSFRFQDEAPSEQCKHLNSVCCLIIIIVLILI